MTNYLLQLGLSNSLLAFAIALLAFLTSKYTKQAKISYFLWLFVLVKLLTPVLVNFPVIPVTQPTAPAGSHIAPDIQLNPESTQLPLTTLAEKTSAVGQENDLSLWWEAIIDQLLKLNTLLWIWLLGSAIILYRSSLRIVRFKRFLDASIQPPSSEIQTLVDGIAMQLRMKTPSVYVTQAKLSPMVWWLGGRIKVILPADLVKQSDREQLRWILAHELVHIKRRDYAVRWLEWLCTIVFWWNPVVWWAQRNLRIQEEICCDRQVIQLLSPQPRVYASALLSAVELLNGQQAQTPAIASGIDSGGSLQKRFRMILSSNNNSAIPHWLQVILFAGAIFFLPLGIGVVQVSAQRVDNDSRIVNSTANDRNGRCAFNATTYDYLVDQVKRGEISGSKALALWETECGLYQGTQDVDIAPLNTAHQLWILANQDSVSTADIQDPSIKAFKCDSVGYEYLIDLVHGAEVSPEQGLAYWENQCGEYSGERVDKYWKKLDLPRHHLWYMANMEDKSMLTKENQRMWALYRNYIAN